MPSIEYHGKKLFYESTGEGDIALLFIHGLLGDHNCWKYQIDHFQDSYEIITIDCFGHGQSDRDISPLEWPSLTAEACVALMNRIDKSWYAIGHSFASNILPEIIKLTVADPNLRGTVFVDCTYQGFDDIIQSRVAFAERLLALNPDSLPKEAELWYKALIGRTVDPKDAEELILKPFYESDYRWMFESVRACREYCEKYPPNDTPRWEDQKILIVEGGETLGRDFDKSWANHFKDARYYLFENDYHFFFISQAKKFNELLTEFIEENN